MSDNVTTSVGDFATDLIGGIHWQRVKVTFGVDGAADDVSTSNRLPVDVGSTLAVTGTFWQATQPISATALPLPTGAATAAGQTSAQTSLSAIAASTADAAPAAGAATITPSDSTVLTGVRSVYVGGTGDVVATIGGTDVTFKAVPVGTVLPIKATKIKATGTTATLMVSLS